MKENLAKSIEELKRANHLVYVSLKYTRTGDILYNIIKRLSDSLEYLINAILIDTVNSKLIDEVPLSPIQKANTLAEIYKDNKTYERIVEIFKLLRQLLKSKYITKNDYRRHLTAYFTLPGKKIYEVDIDKITALYEELETIIKDTQREIIEKNKISRKESEYSNDFIF